METERDQPMDQGQSYTSTKKWDNLRKLTARVGPFAQTEFEASADLLDFISDNCRILVIGAGGLGCELLKDLALMGFKNIDVIDMDTIDLSNLNRQFLFRPSDVGKPKAQCAADFINNRIAGCNVTPHYAKIQDFGDDFYEQFQIVVCGLDSIVARRWINGMLISMLQYQDGQLDESTMIPIIDGGTEGFKGNARLIFPGKTACIECTLDLYPPQVNFPLCTIAHTPRLPEHCIEYARILLWPKEEPFGDGVAIDGDDPQHIQWIFDKASERAKEFNIRGVTYRLTQGVVKRIIPAVASTNAVIAAACASEAFKLVTGCANTLHNYKNFNDTEGVYTYTFEAERKEDCSACSQVPQSMKFTKTSTLKDMMDWLTEDPALQLKAPGITTSIGGKNKTLYIQSIKSIEESTRPNLKKTLEELGLENGHEVYVADVTTPSTITFKLTYVEQ